MSEYKPFTFVTGSQDKADYLAAHLGLPVEHAAIALDEIQSLNLADVATHKAKQAYATIQKPVLVEDVSLEFAALGGLPGSFIKFFMQAMSEDALCRLLDGHDRSATARCVFAYYDGTTVTLFEGFLHGSIAQKPAGDGGFGWDRIFIPDGHTVTRAELAKDGYTKTYTTIKPFKAVREFLTTAD